LAVDIYYLLHKIVHSKADSVFVIGKHRSGTTGLANHLCEHSDIAGVQHEEHWGIHESGYFVYVAGRYGPLGSWSNFREFVEVMSASDYFRLSGIEKEYMLSLWPTTYVGFFKSMMDEFARRQESPIWLEKSPAHTKNALWLAEQYPSARFIGIVRNITDVVASSLFHNGGKEKPEPKGLERLVQITRVIYGWVYYNKSIYALRRRYPSRTLVLKYEKFNQERSNVLKEACSHLKISFEKDICSLPYSRNTSFSGGRTREKSITETERRYIHRLAAVFRRFPYRVYWLLDTLSDRLGRKPDLPSWFFRISDHKWQERIGAIEYPPSSLDVN
jgi:hypothetical protein